MDFVSDKSDNKINDYTFEYPKVGNYISTNKYISNPNTNDMNKYVFITPAEGGDIQLFNSSPTLTFFINNCYIIDCERSFLTIAFKNNEVDFKDNDRRFPCKLFKSVTTNFSTGSTFTTDPFVTFNAKKYFGNFGIYGDKEGTPASISIPLSSICSLFSTDYLYTNLLNGTTTLKVNLQENADNRYFKTKCTISMARICLNTCNNEILMNKLANESKILSKFYRTDCIDFTVNTGKIETISIGSFSPSIVAFAFKLNKAYTNITEFNIDIGSSNNSVFSYNLISGEINNISTMYGISTLIEGGYFIIPTYNFGMNDFSGVNATRNTVTIRISVSESAKLSVCVISNCIGVYEAGMLKMISDF